MGEDSRRDSFRFSMLGQSSCTFSVNSANKLKLRVDNALGEWVKHAEVLDVLLTLAAQDVAHELSGAVIHPLAWLLVNVDVCIALEGISTILHVGESKWNIGPPVFGKIDLLDARIVLGMEDGSPGDAIFVFG